MGPEGADLDWPNIAEEIEDVGWRQLHAVGSMLLQALVDMLKAQARPGRYRCRGGAPTRWALRAQARRRFVPSMRQRIDIAGLYAGALKSIPESMNGDSPLPVAQVFPYTLEELLAV